MNNEENEHTFKTVKAKKVTLKANYKFFPTNKFQRIFNRILIVLTNLLGFWFATRIIMGLKIKGRKNLKKIKNTGAIIIGNHVMQFDGLLHVTTFISRKIWVTMLQSNLGLPFGFGRYIREGGAVPIPEDRTLLKRFGDELIEALNRKELVMVFPEAYLKPYCDHIRPFKKGAFKFACHGNKPILPMVWTFRKNKGLRKLFRRKPSITLNILEPYYIKEAENENKTILNAMNELYEIMNNFYNENSELLNQSKDI